MDVLIALGPHIFYAVHPSFNSFKNELDLDWKSQRRLSRRPAQQFIGPGDETATIEGVLYPERFGNGPELMAGMRASALSGAQLPLIEIEEATTVGSPLGAFVITKLSGTKQTYGTTGPRKIEFTVELKYYGDDGLGIGGGLFG